MDSVALPSSGSGEKIPVCPNCRKYPMLSLLNDNPEKVQIDCPYCKKKDVQTLENMLKSMYPLGKETPENNCEADSNHTSQKAICYCVDCEKWICKQCRDKHLSSETQKTHLLSDTDEIITKNCNEHKLQYESYCTECQLNLCPNCIPTHQHKNTIISTKGTLDLKNIQGYNTFLRSMRTHSQSIGKLYKKIISLIDNYKKEIDEAYEKTRQLNNNIYKMYESFIKQASVNKVNYHIHENLDHFGSFSFKSFKFDIENINLKDITGTDLMEYKEYITEGAIIVEKKTSNFQGLQRMKEWKFNHFVSSLTYYSKEQEKRDFIILGFNNGIVGIVDFLTRDPQKDIYETKDAHKGSVLSIHVDGNFIYTAGSDHTIRKWEIKKGYQKYELEFKALFRGHRDEVNKVLTIPGKNIILSCSADDTIIVWDPVPGETLIKPNKVINLDGRVTSMLLSKDNQYLIAATDQDKVSLMNLTDFKEIHYLDDVYCCSPGCLVYKEDDIIAYGNKILTCISLSNGELKLKSRKGLNDYSNMEFSEDMFSIIPTDDADVILSNLKKSLFKLNPKGNNEKEKEKEKENIQVKTFSEKENIEGLYPIFKNKFAIVFGKRVEILSN